MQRIAILAMMIALTLDTGTDYLRNGNRIHKIIQSRHHIPSPTTHTISIQKSSMCIVKVNEWNNIRNRIYLHLLWDDDHKLDLINFEYLKNLIVFGITYLDLFELYYFKF